MAIDYSKLVQGQEISHQTYLYDADTVSRYAQVLQDSTKLFSDEDGRALVPAMAVAALSFRGVLDGLQLPGGTIHAGQEFKFLKAVAIGDSLGCSAKLLQNSVRRGLRLMVVGIEVNDSQGQKIMEGKSIITVPL